MATMSDNSVLVKLDFRNAFDCLHRDRMLKTVADKIPGLYRFCWLSYYTTLLSFVLETVQSGPKKVRSKATRWVHFYFA